MAAEPAIPPSIKMITVYDNSTKLVPRNSVPLRQQFVMLDKNGVETEDARLAAKKIPIIEVRISCFDANGQLVPTEHAVEMRIIEYGPDENLLRSTTMRKD